MKHVLRLAAVLLLIGSVAILCATLSCNAEAGAGAGRRHARSNSTCALEGCRVFKTAGVVAKAGRITFVQTTCAFARVLARRPLVVVRAPEVAR